MDEYLEILADLSVPEDYERLDQYNDFRKVFLETDQGRRVLRQILAWGHLLKSHLVRMPRPIDPYAVLAFEGERNLALHIFSVMLVEPPERPDEQTTKTKKE
ncbi:hypothetical protein LCGC14_3083590 [marine sediment metagenome]|uniref:Bbp19-like phage domain-containing protein n=1 Tax=marine sediment metagenome TaxID=412755 RepID=A0A0F8WCI7_9ZZZZ